VAALLQRFDDLDTDKSGRLDTDDLAAIAAAAERSPSRPATPP
jgi:Ca2+-binding EF-hand superfamily protein